MGKGDKKTKRGKIYNGTFGVRRPHHKTASSSPKITATALAPESEPVMETKKKPVRKKETAAKKK
ncbi:MAG: 30S ribosomal protein THX [Candidatus Cyclobacteriaceae bacterium M2_1C_046]